MRPVRGRVHAPDRDHAPDQILVVALAVAQVLDHVVVMALVQEWDVALVLTLVKERVVAHVRVVVLLVAHVHDGKRNGKL